MDTSPHPQWPQEGSSSLPEFQRYLIQEFEYLFGNQQNVADVRSVLSWLKDDPSRIFSWGDRDSFSTLFLPFHLGDPHIKKWIDACEVPDRLLSFMKTCTLLEKTTDQFAYLSDSAELEHKEEIIRALEELLRLLPTREEFVRLVEDIRLTRV